MAELSRMKNYRDRGRRHGIPIDEIIDEGGCFTAHLVKVRGALLALRSTGENKPGNANDGERSADNRQNHWIGDRRKHTGRRYSTDRPIAAIDFKTANLV